MLIVILVGYAQTAAVGIVLMTGSTEYTELSGNSWTSKFDRKVSLFFGVFSVDFLFHMYFLVRKTLGLRVSLGCEVLLSRK